MNSLLFFAHERAADHVTIRDPLRLEYVASAHRLACGTTLPVGEWQGARGEGTVIELGPQGLTLHVRLSIPALPRSKRLLIVGISRPQTVRKVIHTATTMGVAELVFVRCERAEKSYLDSLALGEQEIHSEVWRALEQCCDTIPPRISVERRFLSYIEDHLPQQLAAHDCALRLIAHTDSACAPRILPATSGVALAIGSEAGWNDFELQQFANLQFKQFSLGPRILRVETAVAALLGVLHS